MSSASVRGSKDPKRVLGAFRGSCRRKFNELDNAICENREVKLLLVQSEDCFKKFVNALENYLNDETKDDDDVRKAKEQYAELRDEFLKLKARCNDDVSQDGDASASRCSRVSDASGNKLRLKSVEMRLRMEALNIEMEAERQHEIKVAELLRLNQEHEREVKLRKARLEVEIAEELARLSHNGSELNSEMSVAQNMKANVRNNEIMYPVNVKGERSAVDFPLNEHFPDKLNDVIPSVREKLVHDSTVRQSNDFNMLAEALRNGPVMPRVEMSKFSGDPGDYAHFVTSFSMNVAKYTDSSSELFLRLLSLCEGRAREAIKDCINLPPEQMYETAVRTLRENFGMPHRVAEMQIKKLKEFNVRRTDAMSLMGFARKLQESKRVLDSLGDDYSCRLDSEDLIKMLMRKLPDETLKKRWVERAGMILEDRPSVKFMDFHAFIDSQSRRLNNAFSDELKESSIRAPRFTSLAATSADKEDNRRMGKKCSFCSTLDSHSLWKCEMFRQAPQSSRYSFVVKSGYCLRCLRKGHFLNECKSKLSCSFCKSQRHNSLLHREQQTTSEHETNYVNDHREVESNLPKVNVGANKITGNVWLKVVPVKVIGRKKVMVVNAFIDGGSDTTLCTHRLLEELDIEGTDFEYRLTAITGEMVVKGRSANLRVNSLFNGNQYDLKCISVDSIPIGRENFVNSRDMSRFSHLRDITLPDAYNSEVSLLIGSDNVEIVESQMEKRTGKSNEPMAILTCLGWTICGSTGNKRRPTVAANRTKVEIIDIDEKLQALYNAEFQGLVSNDSCGNSPDDQRAEKLMKESIELIDGHYHIALPFKDKAEQHLRNNFYLAEKRLSYLRGKLSKDAELKKGYYQVMQKYVNQGAARRVGKVDKSQRWYLPHHAVLSDKKSEPRVVFDCAAENRGQSLNKALYKGPDNTSPMIEVLMRFRVDQVAVISDIRAMFHQVRVKGEDSKRLSFLWWPCDDMSTEPETYEMTAHVFGATSSPSVCGFALRSCAEDHSSEFSADVINSVKECFYVDDMLCSYPNVEAAISTSKDLSELLNRGGFHLNKWSSNHKEVIESFPHEDRSPSVRTLNLELDPLSNEKTLGVRWDMKNDLLVTEINLKMFQETRRGVLASVASIFDPLGLASPLILRGKLINQELAVRQHDWDEKLPDEVLDAWKDWLSSLDNVRNWNIPRCLKPLRSNFDRVELHHFSDASESGYGTVTYLRFICGSEAVCTFVYGRSRVKPTKKGITIPKLELTAATLLVSIDNMISSSLKGRLDVNEKYFWTDSMIVLRYIHNESKCLNTFVSNRVAKIREISSPSQWRHVKGQENPADIASRGIEPGCSEKWTLWSQGPEFLHNPNIDLEASEMDYTLNDDDEGVRKSRAVLSTMGQADNFWSSLFSKFSSWIRLVRVVSWILRAINDFKRVNTNKGTALTRDELSRSEIIILKNVQNEVFGNLQKVRDASLAKLNPVMLNDLIAVGGRLQHSNHSINAKHPIILPSNHPVTNNLILHYHISHGHVGVHHTLSLLRKTYWIVHGVSAVRQVIGRCHFCRRHNRKVGEQIMASLPAVRVSEEHSFPFEVTGVDLFGPLFVTTKAKTRAQVVRTSSKRYGVLFTCLKCRAVHLEVALDLSTDSFINCFLRFLARRGAPRIIYSDNGTNFRGASSEVIEGLKQLDQNRITEAMASKTVEWRFNSPLASHQGGVWERLVRSVKRVLNAQLCVRAINDDSLNTYLCEVEKIVNDRPLTRMSDDPRDLDCLTPSHFLLVGRNPSLGLTLSPDVDLKIRWKLVSSLAEEFWLRWKKEYVVSLQERQKWLKNKRNFQVGDLVLLADQGVSRGHWKKGVIDEVVKGSDQCVRNVLVRCADGMFRRDIRKLCLLEQDLL